MENNLPKFLGYTDIPTHLKDYNTVVNVLVQNLKPDKAMLLQLPDADRAKHYQHSIINAGTRAFGRGKLQTAVDGPKLYVWMRKDEPDLIKFLSGLKVKR